MDGGILRVAQLYLVAFVDHEQRTDGHASIFRRIFVMTAIELRCATPIDLGIQVPVPRGRQLVAQTTGQRVRRVLT